MHRITTFRKQIFPVVAAVVAYPQNLQVSRDPSETWQTVKVRNLEHFMKRAKMKTRSTSIISSNL